MCFRVAALFLCPPAKFSSSLHSPTVFCEFTSKMVGGFLLLQARSCFLKFFQICRVFVAFSGPFSAYRNRKAHDLHRIFNGQSWVYLWCARGNSNPWPSDQKNPRCIIRQIQKERRIANSFALSQDSYLHTPHYLHTVQCFATVVQPFGCAKSVQKCADGQNKAQWTNQSPVLWQGLGHPNRHRFT